MSFSYAKRHQKEQSKWKTCFALAACVGCFALVACTPDNMETSSSALSAPTINDTPVSSEIQKQIDEEKRAKEEALRDAELAKQDISATLSPELLLESIPSSKEITSFSANKNRSAPSIPEEQLAAIQEACQDVFDNNYTCGCVFIDLGSGRGVACNAQEAIYTASSFKATLSYYLLESGNANQGDRNNIEASILYSDNDSFEALASPHMDNEYRTWLENHGIEYDDWSPWYPTASAKGMTACWIDIYHYTQTEKEEAQWFKDLLANTNISFIRNALEDEDVNVWNKGGWLSDPEYNAVADCGIIEAEGRTYLMAILSNQPSWGETQERVQNIARALFSCRSSLQ